MSMPLSLARRISSGRVTLEDLREEAERTLGAKAASRLRTAPKREPGRQAKEAKRQERNARTAQVRLAVWNRSNRFGMIAAPCDCGCGNLITRETFHMDHWIGGSSRQELTTVENCWALTAWCDNDKTNMGGPNRSTVEEWNERRRQHCVRHDLEFVPRKPTRYAHPSPPASPQETP